MRFQVWQASNGYIQGVRVGSPCTLKTANARTQKLEGYHRLSKGCDDVLVWIENKAGDPIGLIQKLKEQA